MIMSNVSNARDDISRMADDVERVAAVGLAVFVLVGAVASLALIIAVSKQG